MSTLGKLITEEMGQGMAEYGLLMTGIAFVAIAAVYLLGNRVQEFYNGIVLADPN